MNLISCNKPYNPLTKGVDEFCGYALHKYLPWRKIWGANMEDMGVETTNLSNIPTRSLVESFLAHSLHVTDNL